MTVLFVSFILGLARWSVIPPRARRVFAAAAVGTVLWSNQAAPYAWASQRWPTPEQRTLVRELEWLHDHLPRDRPLWATNNLGPYFFDFPKLRCVWFGKPINTVGPRYPFVDAEPHLLVLETPTAGSNPAHAGRAFDALLRAQVESGRYRELMRLSRVMVLESRGDPQGFDARIEDRAPDPSPPRETDPVRLR